MNLEDFLDRVVAPGNWLAVAYKDQTWNNLAHRFFERPKITDAAGYLRALGRKMDTWFAVASFDQAALHTNGKKFIGKRTRENAQQIKSFWADADIKAAHDGKDPAKVFASEAEAVMWATAFGKATGIPIPNIWIKSGYGLHIYWSFEDALDVDTWRGYAEALKAALIANNFKGDVNVVADAARILRPPETQNFKVPANPVPCFEFVPHRLTKPDYPNVALLPILGKLPTYKPAPKTTTTRSGSTIANARAGFTARPRDFEIMAANCAQVGQSLVTHGLTDHHDLWWRMLKLAEVSEDGRTWAHEVGSAHPTYTQADTDAEYDKVEIDHRVNHKGPPSCVMIDGDRPGICHICPHWTNPAVKGPFNVGLQLMTGSPDDLPERWRRNNGWIERLSDDDKKTTVWYRQLEGDITEPVLDYLGGSYRLTVTYAPPNTAPRALCVDNVELNARTAKTILCSRGMHVNDDRAPYICRLLMAWIDKLQRECRVRTAPMPSFGWYRDGDNYLGFSTGGVCYTAGGGDEQAPGADASLISNYTPRGSLANWRTAAEFIGEDCPGLQTTIAVAFAAPLMELQGGSGAVLSFVGKSGIGKSAATYAGQAVWADPKLTVLSVSDTSTYKGLAIGQVKSLPIYWDEAKADDEIKKLINEIHTFTQGRDRGRGTADVRMRTPGEWSTIYSISTNDSIRDLITSHHGDVEATLLRLLEIRVERTLKYKANADAMVSSLRDNRGEAGVIYARYLADNVDTIKLKLANKKTSLDRYFNPTNDERFYIATAAAVIVGAELARDLNIIDLDIKGIVTVLVDAIKKSRNSRKVETPIDPKDKLIGQLDEFITAYQQECIVTDTMKKHGPGPKPRLVHWPKNALKDKLGIAYHIGVNDKVVRINSNVWRTYWNSRVISPTDLRAKASAEWGVPHASDRGLGHGTEFQVAKAYTFTLSLAYPELEEILDPYVTAAPAKRTVGSTVIQLPTPTR
jgi:hypothetical protein